MSQRVDDLFHNRLGADLARAHEALPAFVGLVVLQAQRPGLAGASEGEAGLRGDEGMLRDRLAPHPLALGSVRGTGGAAKVEGGENTRADPVRFGIARLLAGGCSGRRERVREDRLDIVGCDGTIALAVDLHQRFEPVHAPAGHAVDLMALGRKGIGETVGAGRAGEGVVGDADDGHADCTSFTMLSRSSRTCMSSPVRAAGPALHRPRQ